MKKQNLIVAVLLFVAFLAFSAASVLAQSSKLKIPIQKVELSPILEWKKFDAEATGSDGLPYVGVTFAVTNRLSFSDALFAHAPDLPACGANDNSSRTWLDIFVFASGKRIYGFCALENSEQMNSLSFNVKRENLPDCIYITLTDRQTKKKYKSNAIQTTEGDNARCQKPSQRID